MFTRFCRFRRLFGARKFCTIGNILKNGPQNAPITINGWILRLRNHKQYTFLGVGDGLSPDTIQVVLEKEKLLDQLKLGSAVTMTGDLVPSLGKGQKYDFIPKTVDYVGAMDGKNYPLGGKEKLEEGCSRQFLHLRPKMGSFSALLRVRNVAKRLLHNYFQDRGFLYVDTPILTLNDCEGAGEAFYVEPADKVKLDAIPTQSDSDDVQEQQSERYFFSRPAYTTVSAQLHLEAAACALRHVYTFNPAFRAESSLSRHHLAEFYMLEAEMAFVNDLEPLLGIVEDLFRQCSNALLDGAAQDYATCAKRHNVPHMKTVERILTSTASFPRLPYKEAVDILEKGASQNFFGRPRMDGFTREHERYLVEHCGNLPVFVTEFPASAKPFYMARSKANPENAVCFDFLVPLTGEIVGGGLRESDYNSLEQRLVEVGHREKLEWYLDLRKFGYPRTGGFGLGFERYVQWLLGITNIKDALPFPRWYNHCYL